MNREQIIESLSINGKIVTKRCTTSYCDRHNITPHICAIAPPDFISISDKIKFIIYGGGYCRVCGARTSVAASGRGFADYCKDHFHHAKKGKVAHNNKEVDIERAISLYINDKKSILTISKILGGVSNVTLKKKLIEAGVELRTHSENQKINSVPNKGKTNPLIIIDRGMLRELYCNQKMPINVIAENYKCHPETVRRFLIQEGIERTNRTSVNEWIIIDILKKHNINYKTNCKTIIQGDINRDIDFLLYDYNVAIETHGLYTHSKHVGGKYKKYHKEKYDECIKQGIHLFQFWDVDLQNPKRVSIIESMILNKCGKTFNKVFARKCKLYKVSYKDAYIFFEDNHIQGAPSKNCECWGLYYDNILVSLLSLQKGIITRFCNLKFTSVVGGFSKIISKLPRPLVTYSSNDISNGDLYLKNGFVLTGENMDMYYTDFKQILNRQHFMKHKLKDKLTNFDPNITEEQNMVNHGFDVIYKSGTKTWTLN